MSRWISKKIILSVLKILPYVLLGLTPVVWFVGKGNTIINGIDTNFPLEPVVWFLRRFHVWNNIANGGSDFSSSIAGVFFHLIQVVPYELGLGLQGSQIFSLVFWFSATILSSYILARTLFPQRYALHLLFVVLYSFNIYLFNSWENVKVANLSLIASIPISISILLKLKNDTILLKRGIFYATLVGVLLSGSGINPAYFISFYLILMIFLISLLISGDNPVSKFKILRDFGGVGLIIFLVNLYWILPTLNFIFGNIAPSGSIDKIGFHNWVDSLSKNTSILNIMRMQGAWDWYAFDSTTNLPLYIPYALNYFYRLPFILFSFLLPFLAILSFFQRKNNKENYLFVSFGIMLLVGVFLGVGTHLPTGALFRWLSVHFPFFSLFRSPWYIFTPLVGLSIAGLVTLFFYNLEEKISKIGPIYIYRPLLTIFVLVIAIGNLVYSYPLITGKIFRPSRNDGFFISFPNYIFDAGKWLKEGEGRIIGYPDDEIENFEWKYRGIESILELLSDREVVFMPLNTPDANFSKLTKEFYSSLKRKEFESMKSLAYRLNVSMIFDKKDQGSITLGLPTELNNLPSVTFGKWRFINLFPDTSISKIRTSSKLMFGISDSMEQIFGPLKRNELLVNPNDSVVKSFSGVFDQSGQLIQAKNSQVEELNGFISAQSKLSNRLLRRDVSNVVYSFVVPKFGKYRPLLERFSIEDFGLDPQIGINAELDGNPILIIPRQNDDSYVSFEPIELSEGNHNLVLRLSSPNLIKSGGFESEEGFIKRGNGDYRVLGDKNEKYLNILNSEGLSSDGNRDISASFKVNNFDPLRDYLVQFRYKQIFGSNPSSMIVQKKGDILVKVQVEALPNYPEWNNFSFYYQPVKTESEMDIELISPFIYDPLGTKVSYDELEAYAIFTNDMLFINDGVGSELPLPEVTTNYSSPTKYEGGVVGGESPHFIVFADNYSPNWEITVFDDNGMQLPVSPSHFSADMYANGWFMENLPSSYKFRIFYKPQRLFLIGSTVSVGIMLLSTALFIFGRKNEKRN